MERPVRRASSINIVELDDPSPDILIPHETRVGSHRPREGKKSFEPVSIDDSRVFYRETSPTPGGMRMNWVDYIPQVEAQRVSVRYSGGYEVILEGRDAHKFLMIVRDKHAHLFAEQHTA